MEERAERGHLSEVVALCFRKRGSLLPLRSLLAADRFDSGAVSVSCAYPHVLEQLVAKQGMRLLGRRWCEVRTPKVREQLLKCDPLPTLVGLQERKYFLITC